MDSIEKLRNTQNEAILPFKLAEVEDFFEGEENPEVVKPEAT
jgi:hypothetical protein